MALIRIVIMMWIGKRSEAHNLHAVNFMQDQNLYLNQKPKLLLHSWMKIENWSA